MVLNIEAATGDGQVDMRMLPELATISVQGAENADFDTHFAGKAEHGSGGTAKQLIEQWPVVVEKWPEYVGHGESDVLPVAVGQDVLLRCNPLFGGFDREALVIEVDFSLPASRVVRTLEQLIEWKGKPAAIRCDNGPEYTGNVLISWAARQNIDLRFIQPGKPQQNAYIERYNRTVRYDWPGQYLFTSLDELQDDATRCNGFIITNVRIWR